LGELSFSLYLIHMPVRTYLEFARVHLSSFGAWWNALPNFVKGWEYGLGCLLAALALWWFVECPARKAARAWWQSREADVTGRQWSTTIATALVLGTLVTTANVSGLR
jgi:peptidoglycan/LPS O-acetylase OafA/YrhL